jgi:Domain of unknown function (DUF4440)
MLQRLSNIPNPRMSFSKQQDAEPSIKERPREGFVCLRLPLMSNVRFHWLSQQEVSMSRRAIIGVLGGYLWALSGGAVGGEVPDRGKETVQWMIAQEKAWAEQSCGKPWVLSELLATDFHGTSPKGTRYDRPTEVPTYDPATFHSDCRLLDADVRFFGDNVAVVYGSESSVAVLPDSKHERRCLVWTDTWLKRKGRWQIIAVQDARIDCPPT